MNTGRGRAAARVIAARAYRTHWQVRGRTFELDRPRIFGIVNVTPDSFSDGGMFLSASAAMDHAACLFEDGADGIDVGGESTRPQGASAVPVREEIARVVPLIDELRAYYPSSFISVDTVKSEVAAECLAAGADIVNDVSGFRLDSRMSTVCAESGAGVVLMHSRGGVSDMSTYDNANYGEDVMGEVISEVSGAISVARRDGVEQECIVVDPGLGFSKRSHHSLQVLNELPRLVELGYPVLVGASRKRFVGEASGVKVPSERVFGSVAASVVALTRGAMLFRVHDVRATRQALDVAWAIISEGRG